MLKIKKEHFILCPSYYFCTKCARFDKDILIDLYNSLNDEEKDDVLWAYPDIHEYLNDMNTSIRAMAIEGVSSTG